MSRNDVLVTVDWVQDHLGQPGIVLVEVEPLDDLVQLCHLDASVLVAVLEQDVDRVWSHGRPIPVRAEPQSAQAVKRVATSSGRSNVAARFGAVSVVSGKIAGQTETLTLLVEKRFQNFDLAGAYAASALLALIALLTLLAMTLLKPRKEPT